MRNPLRSTPAWPLGDATVVVLLLALATCAGLLLPFLSLTSHAMLYVLAVVAASHRVSLPWALACAVGAVLLLNFFFVQPLFAFRVEAQENLAALAVMLAVSVVISQRSVALRRETEAAHLSETRARQLQELAMELAAAASEEEIRTAGESLLAGLGHAEQEHAQAIQSLLDQSLQRLELATSVRAAEESSRWHRSQSTFLAGISHDFRTPLAAVVAAASSLQTQHDKLSAAEQQRLAQIIADEAAHLATLTENTLNLARLANAGELALDWQSMEEIVGVVLARVRQRDPARRIHSGVAPALPLIKGDPVLLAQLLENLLDNALKYSAGGIELLARHDHPWLELLVQDRGQGVAPGDEEAIFEPYRRSDRSGQRGAGLGLAVCRAIARAHGGEVDLRRREGGGSTFAVRLPVAAMQPEPYAE